VSEEMRHLYRSRENRWIAGVCGGLGEYLNMDPTVMRVLLMIFGFVGLSKTQARLHNRMVPLVSGLYALAAGSGILGYLISCILIPVAPTGAGTELSAEPGVATAS